MQIQKEIVPLFLSTRDSSKTDTTIQNDIAQLLNITLYIQYQEKYKTHLLQLWQL